MPLTLMRHLSQLLNSCRLLPPQPPTYVSFLVPVSPWWFSWQNKCYKQTCPFLPLVPLRNLPCVYLVVGLQQVLLAHCHGRIARHRARAADVHPLPAVPVGALATRALQQQTSQSKQLSALYRNTVSSGRKLAHK